MKLTSCLTVAELITELETVPNKDAIVVYDDEFEDQIKMFRAVLYWEPTNSPGFVFLDGDHTGPHARHKNFLEARDWEDRYMTTQFEGPDQ